MMRPRRGILHRATDGSQVPVRFVTTDQPETFLAVRDDGSPIQFDRYDRLDVDMIAAGQRIITSLGKGLSAMDYQTDRTIHALKWATIANTVAIVCVILAVFVTGF